jgi:ATP-dependent exoDNAse (exonuclease V) alpha subunit
LNSDLLALIEHRLNRFNRRYKQRPERDIKLILVGDVLQLPIFFSSKIEEKAMTEKYGSPYFFKSRVFKEMNFKVHALSQVNRTKDKTFMAALDAMRYGQKSRYPRLCQWLNKTMYRETIPEGLPVMTCWNKKADQINRAKLEANPNRLWQYYSEVHKKYNIKDCPVGDLVEVKVGAKVMTVVNDNQNGQYNNGSMGVVTHCEPDFITVKFDHSGQEVDIGKHEFEQQEPYEDGVKVDAEGNESPNIKYRTAGYCLALPIQLAYGLSIHRSQGENISSPCVLDLGPKGFWNEDFGPALPYVGLSRFTDPSLCYLEYPIKPQHIWVKSEILKWVLEQGNE